MRMRSQRGSVVEAVPILVLGVLLVLAGLQLSFFMAGRHTAELAAFRASRILDEDAGNRAKAIELADRTCRLGYPDSLSSVHVDVRTPASEVTVHFRLEPLLGLHVLPGARPFGPMTIKARHPRPLPGVKVNR